MFLHSSIYINPVMKIKGVDMKMSRIELSSEWNDSYGEEKENDGEPVTIENVVAKPEFEDSDAVGLNEQEVSSITNEIPPKPDNKPKRKKQPPIRKCGCIEPSFLINRLGASLVSQLGFHLGAGKRLLTEKQVDETCKRWVYALERQEDFYTSYKKVEAAIARGLPLPPTEGLRYIKILNTISGTLVKGRNDIIGVKIKNSLYDDIYNLMMAHEEGLNK